MAAMARGGEEREEAATSRGDVVRAIDALVDECRTSALWYLRKDYYPSTDDDRVRILDAIQRRANRDVFHRAGLLKTWLSRPSSDASARS